MTFRAMQILLKDESGQQELEKWPQYHGRLVSGPGNKKYLHMNTLQYFLLWTAFYVLRSGQNSSGQSTSSRRPVFASATFGNMRKVRCSNAPPGTIAHVLRRSLLLSTFRHVTAVMIDSLKGMAHMITK